MGEMAFVSRIVATGPPRWVSVAVVALAVLGVFGNALDNGFVWDDEVQVVNNPWIKDVRYLGEIFSSDVFRHYQTVEHTNYYRPVAHTVYLATWYVFGLDARAFHAVNVLLHLAATLLVLAVARRLLSASSAASKAADRRREGGGQTDARIHWAALLAALLFAVHPIHTEAVTWISGLMEPLYTLLGLLSFWLFLEHRRRGSRTALLLSTLLFLLALLSKETAVVLLPLFVLWDLCRDRKVSLGGVLRADYVPYGLALALYLALRTYALGRFVPRDMHPELTAWECLINVFPLLAQHLWGLVWPVDLNVFHVFRPVHSILEPRALLGLGVGAACLAAVYVWWRRDRLACFASLLVLLPLLPFFYIRGIAPVLYAEQHLYLPSVGLALLAGRGALRAASVDPRWRAGLYTACAVALCLLAAGTVRRNPVWRDNLTLWSDAVTKSPDSGFVHESLGGALLARGRVDEALGHYERILEVDAEPSARVYNNLGIAYTDKGWTSRAVEAFTRALEIRPDYARAHLGLGIALYQMGQIEKAIEEFRLATRYDPYLADAYHNLGVAYLGLGRQSEAREAMGQASRVDPDYYARHR